jgi:acetyl esterase/lipase
VAAARAYRGATRRLFAIPAAWLAAAVFAAACSPARVVNALVPTDALVATRDIAYGEHPRQRLDLYEPRGGEAPAAGRPLVVFFYGGSWDSGERAQYLFVAEALVSRGFVVAVPDYRVYPEVVFPAFVEDGAQAVAWARRNARDHGADPDRIFVMGHSAGAHIAAMLAFDAHYLAAVGESPATIAGLVGLAGPYDFLPLTDERLKIIFAPEATIARTQPITFVRGGEPPALLITGDSDRTVSPGNTERLARRLREVGARVIDVREAGLSHLTVVGYLAAPLRRNSLLEEIAAFVASTPARAARVSGR